MFVFPGCGKGAFHRERCRTRPISTAHSDQFSRFNDTVMRDYGVGLDKGALAGLSGRAVFVVDEDQRITYRWAGDGIRELPEMDAIEDTLAGTA